MSWGDEDLVSETTRTLDDFHDDAWRAVRLLRNVIWAFDGLGGELGEAIAQAKYELQTKGWVGEPEMKRGPIR